MSLVHVAVCHVQVECGSVCGVESVGSPPLLNVARVFVVELELDLRRVRETAWKIEGLLSTFHLTK